MKNKIIAFVFFIFFCVMLSSPKPWQALGTLGKTLMSRGALSQFHNVLTSTGEVIEY
jgi:hypothetical protein